MSNEQQAPNQTPDLRGQIEDLQMRLTWQEQEIEQINQVLEHQRGTMQRQSTLIARLEKLLSALSEQASEGSGAAVADEDFDPRPVTADA